jgi:AcrR family transcriptional regulator
MSDTLDLDASLGRRERKKRATRLALKAAALDLVAERGFANVTVEDIADAVDVSVRTFFNYFASKEAALVGEDPERIERMKADLVGLPAEMSPLDAARTVLVDRALALSEEIEISGDGHAAWMRRLAVVRSQPEVLTAYTKHLTVVEQALTEAIVERLGGDESTRHYASLVAMCSIGAMRVAGTSAVHGDGGSLVRLVEKSFDLLAAGLEPRPGAARPGGSRRTLTSERRTR